MGAPRPPDSLVLFQDRMVTNCLRPPFGGRDSVSKSLFDTLQQFFKLFESLKNTLILLICTKY